MSGYEFSMGKIVLRRFLCNKFGIIGIILISLIILFCYIAPVFYPYTEFQEFLMVDGVEYSDMSDVEYADENTVFKFMSFAKPSLSHPLGTYKTSNDVLIKVMLSGRVTITIGLICSGVSLVIGSILGILAGLYTKYFDSTVMRFAELILCIPAIPLLLIISRLIVTLYHFTDIQAFITMILTVGCLSFAKVARIIRAQVLYLKEQEFIQALDSMGIGRAVKIFRHIIPNLIPSLVVAGTVNLGEIILIESTLSFLNVYIGRPAASWGYLISAATDFSVLRNNPNIWIPPGICIFVTISAFNFLGEGLRQAFDPKHS